MYTLSAPAPDQHHAPFSTLSAHTWNTSPDDILDYIQRAQPSNLFTLTRTHYPSNPIAGLLALPLHQHIANTPVSMTGIAGVAVAPHERGQGAATALMQHTVRTLHERGSALSTLYPTTQPLYARAGYTPAGTRFRHVTDLRTLSIPKSLPADIVRPTTPEDLPHIETLYTQSTQHHDGTLQRSPYIWKRLRTRQNTTVHAYTTTSPNDPNTITGAWTYIHTPQPHGYDISLLDVITPTLSSAVALLRFLKNHATLSHNATWHGPLQHPILHIPRDICTKTHVDALWMTRITHLHNALTAPRYPKHLDATLQLDVHDELIPEHHGVWTLHIQNGTPSLLRETTPNLPTLQLSIEHLTTLYTGFHSPQTLVNLGAKPTHPQALNEAHRIFPTANPSMADYF